MKHADIYENYKKGGKHRKHHKLNENVAKQIEVMSNLVQKTRADIGEIQSQSVEGKSQTKQKNSNDERRLHVSNEPEQPSVEDEVLVDEIKEEPIVIEIDMSEPNDEFEYGEYSDWQEFEVEVIGDDTDLGELVL